MEFWRGLLDVDPVAWLFVALPVPVGLAAAWYGGFRRNGQTYQRKRGLLFAACRAGLLVELPVVMLGGWLSSSMTWKQSAALGAIAGCAVGLLGVVLLVFSERRWDLTRRFYDWHYHKTGHSERVFLERTVAARVRALKNWLYS